MVTLVIYVVIYYFCLHVFHLSRDPDGAYNDTNGAYIGAYNGAYNDTNDH